MENFNAEKVQAIKELIRKGLYDFSAEFIADTLIADCRRLLRAPSSKKRYVIDCYTNLKHDVKLLRLAS